MTLWWRCAARPSMPDALVLKTDRLMLRPIGPADADNLFRLQTDPLVVRLTGNGAPPTRADTDARLARYPAEWTRHGLEETWA